jgi:hypothetical protein
MTKKMKNATILKYAWGVVVGLLISWLGYNHNTLSGDLFWTLVFGLFVAGYGILTFIERKMEYE